MPQGLDVHQYCGYRYTLVVDGVDGRGYSAQAVVWRESGGVVSERQVVGSADIVLLPTREEAERIATRLAREWIEELG